MRSHNYVFVALFFLCAFFVGHIGDAHAQYPGFDAPGSGKASVGSVGLVAVESEIDGGSIPVGAASQVVVLFRNEGVKPVQTGKINLYPSSNVSGNVTLNQCSLNDLPSGAECAIAISVKGLQAGAWRLEMLMLHSGRSRLVTTTLSGSVQAGTDSSARLSSDIETIPNELDFGALGSSQTLVQPVVLRNITSNPVNVEDIAINASESAGYSVDSGCTTLNAGQACIATVTWAPQQNGPSTGVLVIKHDGASGLASVPLTGDYDPDDIEEAEIFPEAVPGKGLLVSSQTEVDFGEDVSSASTITVSLVNTGDSELALKDIKVSGSDNGLSVAANGCSDSLVLQPIEACPLTITWTPTRIGSVLDDVQIVHSGARGILVLPIRGRASEVVSQDQKAIVLSSTPTRVIDRDDVAIPSQNKQQAIPSISNDNAKTLNASSALDGLKITSFSATRAIVNGPSGSKLIFDDEPIVLGGIMWHTAFQPSGIEFLSGENRILLLFDRSLSSINRVSGQSANRTSSLSSQVETTAN